MATTFGPLAYTDYDMDALILQLQQRLQNVDGAWKDTVKSGTGEASIETQSALANLVMYMLERRAEENYLPTSQLRSSVLNIVSLLGFAPRRNVSATGPLVFSLAAPLANRVFIPAGTIVSTTGNVQFRTTSDVVLLVGQTSVTTSGIQGVQVSASVVSDGSTNFTYNVNDTAIENTNLSVYVDNVLWSPIDSFLLSLSSDTVYRVVPQIDDTVSIEFGDGSRGAIPSGGSTVLVKYIQSLGLDGNVYTSNTITTIVSTLYNDLGLDVSSLVSVANPESVLGGDNPESTDLIRLNAPQVFATGDRAVTKPDHVAILLAYPGVAAANAWGESEEVPPNYDKFNLISLSVVLQDWQLPSNTFKTTLGEYLQNFAMQTVKYEFVDPTIVQVVPSIDLEVKQGFVLSQVQSDVETAIAALFVLGDTIKLGTGLLWASVAEAIKKTPGVFNYHGNLYLYKSLIHHYDSLSQWGNLLDVLPILPGSVGVYDGTRLVGMDNGADSFVSLDSRYVFNASSGVNYTTGYIRVNFTSAPALTAITVLYRQDNNGDVTLTHNQILQLSSVAVTSISFAS